MCTVPRLGSPAQVCRQRSGQRCPPERRSRGARVSELRKPLPYKLMSFSLLTHKQGWKAHSWVGFGFGSKCPRVCRKCIQVPSSFSSLRVQTSRTAGCQLSPLSSGRWDIRHPQQPPRSMSCLSCHHEVAFRSRRWGLRPSTNSVLLKGGGAWGWGGG